jgi:uncharacterized protein (DUF2384 family)
MSKKMITTTSRQRRLLTASLSARIRKLERLREKLHHVDHEVYMAGTSLFGSEAVLAQWLCEPARSLGGKIPLRVMRTAKGRATVASVLRAIGQGNYL